MWTDSDAERAANEAVFREANEQIRKAEERFDPPVERIPYICECDDTSCRELIPLTRDEYEAVRSDPTHFVLRRGHSTQGTIIEERDDYVIARKTGTAAEVARTADPRQEAR
jgi:hypothetical protein